MGSNADVRGDTMADVVEVRGDLVNVAQALAPEVAAAGPEAQRLRHVPETIVRRMAAAGLYKLCAPKELGGFEADPESTIRVIEAISESDGSVGWALMIGVETVGIGGSLMPLETAARLFTERPDLVMCGALNPQGRATKVDGGYIVSGTWPFASGCHHATYFWGQCVIVEPSGTTTARQPRFVDVIVPRADYEVVDTWHVNGLRGSGSHDVRLTDCFVADSMTTGAVGSAPDYPGPLFRLPPFSRLAYNKVGVATGVARAAIDTFTDLAMSKKPRLSSSSLRDRPRAQLALAQAEARLRAARAFVFDAVGDEWETVLRGDRATRRQRALVRLACSHACQEAIAAVELVHSAAGTSANLDDSVIGRARRDVAVVAQQLMVAPHFIEDAGRVLLGLDPNEPIL